MRKILIAGFVMIMFAGLAAAQVPTSGNVFFGYSYQSSDPLGAGRINLNGWEASVEGKIVPFVGVVADFSEYFGSQTVTASCGGGAICTVSTSPHEYNVMFGPRVSVPIGRFRPFGEALFGLGHIGTDGLGADNSFATALGGGLDFRIVRPIAWRFQGDYLQTRFFGATQNNVRLSTGIVLRF